jgi:hypothetical protein
VVTEALKVPHGAEELLLDCWGSTELLELDEDELLLEDARKSRVPSTKFPQ